MTGYDTAGAIQDTYASAHNEFRVEPGLLDSLLYSVTGR